MLSYMKCGKTECEKPRLLEKAFCEEHAAAARETAQPLINQKIPLDECLVEYRNNGSQLFMRFEDETVLRFALAEPSLPPRAEAILKAILGKIHEWRVIGSDPEVLLESRNLHVELADEMEQAFDSAEPVAAAQRGTTPPEGLAFTFEEFIDMSLRHNKRLAAGISGIASFGHWYNEMLAATQRAPVEQGRDGYFVMDGTKLLRRAVGETAAPDHAREVALPSRGKLLAEASYWHNCAETKPSSFENATQWDILHYCAGIVERALADGKEGGE